MPTIKTARILSILIITLAVIASLGGLLLRGLYRDNLFVSSDWKGNDLVTLVVAVPILVAASTLALRGPGRSQLIWVGMLDYVLYNYAFYLFAAAFYWFFLLYVALFGLSILALIFALTNLDVTAISAVSESRRPTAGSRATCYWWPAGSAWCTWRNLSASSSPGKFPVSSQRPGTRPVSSSRWI